MIIGFAEVERNITEKVQVIPIVKTTQILMLEFE
jgi:hypothetical protein